MSEPKAMQAQLRAHTKTLGALRQSQLEQGKEMREGFARVDAEARQNYAMLAHGQQRITDLLTRSLGECESGEDG
jgi:hypothetical protein